MITLKQPPSVRWHVRHICEKTESRCNVFIVYAGNLSQKCVTDVTGVSSDRSDLSVSGQRVDQVN